MTQDLSGKILDIVQVRRRFRYRRIHAWPHLEFWGLDHKRMDRLHCRVTWLCNGARRLTENVLSVMPLQVPSRLSDDEVR